MGGRYPGSSFDLEVYWNDRAIAYGRSLQFGGSELRVARHADHDIVKAMIRTLQNPNRSSFGPACRIDDDTYEHTPLNPRSPQLIGVAKPRPRGELGRRPNAAGGGVHRIAAS